jgi:hypothetical protein
VRDERRILGQRNSGDDDCDLASANDREAEALSRGC